MVQQGAPAEPVSREQVLSSTGDDGVGELSPVSMSAALEIGLRKKQHLVSFFWFKPSVTTAT